MTNLKVSPSAVHSTSFHSRSACAHRRQFHSKYDTPLSLTITLSSHFEIISPTLLSLFPVRKIILDIRKPPCASMDSPPSLRRTFPCDLP